MNNKKLLLVGAGILAIEYIKILLNFDLEIDVVGKSTNNFGETILLYIFYSVNIEYQG